MLLISVLGAIEVTRDGRSLRVPAGKTAELLVRLALEGGTLVRTERLIEDLWGADAVSTGRNTLQSKIAKLRRALEDPALIESGDGGYTLNVEASQVDALAVLTHSATASQLLAAGDASGAAQASGSTLQSLRADLLAGAGAGDWVGPHLARLEEARITLLEVEFSARLQLGHDGDVIGDMEAAVAAHPFQEGLWELLITALYRAGRQADALATYRRIKAQLGDDLGLDPGPRLQELERKILSHDTTLDRPRGAASAVTGNIPSLTVELVGRERELNEVIDLLATKRLVEIVGPGGIGKTALALATGRSVGQSNAGPLGGVWLVRLDMASTVDDVIDTVAAELRVTGGEAALFERLKDADTLVILDNCEHVVDAAAALATRLLDAAPRLRILCTSQVRLDVPGESVVELAPLSLASAVELFASRANSRRLKHSAQRDGDSVQDLCRALDGLPLAIELAAARTRTLSVEDIIRRLDDRFAVLSDPASRRPERRRALRETIRWSYDLLFPDDQRGLWALATFTGSASLPAVESVLESLQVPRGAVIDVLERLASRSLVIVDDDETPHLRYRLLDSIRAFALEELDAAGQRARAFAAHSQWFADAARVSTAGVRSSEQAAYLSFARAERANIDAALAWTSVHDPALGLDIATGFGWSWVVLGDSRGAQRILSALAAAGEGARDEDRVAALLLAAWIEASSERLLLAREHIATAMHLADRLGDDELQARAAYYLAYVVSHQGEFHHALQLTDRSAVLYGAVDRPWDGVANALFAARAAISAGEHESAVDALDTVRALLPNVDDPWLHVRCEAMFGELARMEHRFDDAVRHLAHAAETSGRLGFRQTEAYQLFILGRAQSQAGDYESGAATLSVAIDKAEATGDMRLAALARVHLGRMLRALGRQADARAALESAGAWHRAAGGGEHAALGECLLAAMDCEQGVDGSVERLVAITDDARRADQPHVELFALDALARHAIQVGDTGTAKQLSEEADRCLAAASHLVTQFDRTDAVRQEELDTVRAAGVRP